MRLIRCRKCGATIATDETFIQRMMDDINELAERARKDRRNSPSYLQQAAAIRKIMQQYLHVTANMDDQQRRLTNEQSVLIHYIRENKLISDEKLNELSALARATGTETAAAQEQEMTIAQNAMREFQEATEDAGEGVDGLGDSMVQNQEAIQGIKDEIKALAEAYKNAYDAAYSSISGQIGLFGEFSAEMDENVKFSDDMVKRWQEQTQALTAYNENLKKAAEYQLDNSLIAELADGTAESAAYLAQM